MPTPLTDAIQALTRYANETTGQSDTTLSDAVETLVNGYGQGGGGWTTDGIALNLEPNGDIVLGSSVTKTESGAFFRKPITSLTAPEVITVGDSTARYCASLKRIYMPKARTNAGGANYLFSDCANLEWAELPEMTSTGSYIFATCRKLTHVHIPKVTSIRPNSFQNDNALPCIDIGANCTDIQGNAFNACYALQLMVLRRTASVTTLVNVSAFTNSPFRGYNSLTADLYVPSALISSYQSASNWSTILTEGYTTIHAIEGSIYETQYADGTPIE